MTTLTKDCNRHVTHAEEIARGPGFRDLRDRIIELAAPQPGEVAVDVDWWRSALAYEEFVEIHVPSSTMRASSPRPGGRCDTGRQWLT